MQKSRGRQAWQSAILFWPICGLVACGPSSEGTHEAPIIRSAQALAVTNEELAGKRVILVGRLTVDNAGRYRIEPYENNDEADTSHAFGIELSFVHDPVDRSKMERCLRQETDVTGTMTSSMSVDVEYIHLSSDVQAHNLRDCYRRY